MDVPVLVVDDDAAIRLLLRSVLEDAGYAVSEASDGRQALDYLRRHADGTVVLLDVNMPIMNGMEVMRVVEGEPALATRNPFLILTAQHGRLPPAFVQQLGRMGVPLLAKPFALKQVLAAVAAAAQRLRLSPTKCR